MQSDQIWKRFKQFNIPLNNRLLFLPAALVLVLRIILLESFENVLKLFLFLQHLDHSPKKSAIHVLNQLLATRVDPF